MEKTFKRMQPLTNPRPRLFITEKTSPNMFSNAAESRPENIFFRRFLYRSLVTHTHLGFAISCKCLNPFQPFLSLNNYTEISRFVCFPLIRAPKRERLINHFVIIVHFAQLLALLMPPCLQLSKTVRKILHNSLIFAVDRTLIVNGRLLSLAKPCGDLINLAIPSRDPCVFRSSSVTDLKRILQGMPLFS